MVMTYAVNKIEIDSAKCPSVLQKMDIQKYCPYVWNIGHLDILGKNLLGFFCSVKCPGNIILKTYDLARSLRDSGITVISGFHSPIEKDVFEILLRGPQPLVFCPARSIENMRINNVWEKRIENGSLLILSPFTKKHKRVTAMLSEQRNQFVAVLARDFFLPYAAPGSRSEKLCREIIRAGKQVFTFGDKANQSLLKMGAKHIKDLKFEL